MFFFCRNGTVATGIEVLYILVHLHTHADWAKRELSEISSEVSSHIFDNYGYLLQSLNQPWLQPDCLQSFADAISGRDLRCLIVGGSWMALFDRLPDLENTRECYTMGIKGCMH